MTDVCRNLDDTLRKETGVPGIGVCIWRKDKSEDHCVEMRVDEFLSKLENQTGTWLIDGGWGGPPGPIHVDWDAENNAWINQGFGGRYRTSAREGTGSWLVHHSSNSSYFDTTHTIRGY